MDKMVKPVFPKSIEEHDREVNETWQLDNGIDSPFTASSACPDWFVERKLNALGPEMRKYVSEWRKLTDPIFGDEVIFTFSPTEDLKIEFLSSDRKNEVTLFKKKQEQKLYADNEEFTTIPEREEIPYRFNSFEAAKSFIKAKLPSDYKCEFCCDGDVHECGKSLFKEYLCLEKTPIADIDIYVDENNELAMLVTNTSDMPIIHTTMKIKHCPMCGRLLDNKHEQDNLKQLMKETLLNGVSEDLADAILNGDDRVVAEKIEESKNLIDIFKEGADV